MAIEKRSLIFDHLLVYKTKQRQADWQEGFFMMENFTLNEEIYKNGPVFFAVEKGEAGDENVNFTYYLPINESVILEAQEDFSYLKRFQIQKALVLRQADEEMDFTTAYEKLKAHATEEGIELEDTYYCVLLEVYQEYIIDLYVPIKGTGR